MSTKQRCWKCCIASKRGHYFEVNEVKIGDYFFPEVNDNILNIYNAINPFFFSYKDLKVTTLSQPHSLPRPVHKI